MIFDESSFSTNFVLGGKQIDEAAKYACEVVAKYCKKNIQNTVVNPSNDQRKLQKILEQIPLEQITYDKLVEAYEASASFEHLTAKLLIGFMSSAQTDPVRMLQYVYGRTPPLNSQTDWMDNFRINNIGYPLIMLRWGKFDPDKGGVKTSPGTIYSVHLKEPLPINTSIDLGDKLYKRVLEFLVTPFRAILTGSENLSPKEICDRCYEEFAVCYGGAHGWDIFHIDSMSLSIEEIAKVLRRYPSWNIMYVLNTATYASRNGVHWVALDFCNENNILKAKLVCSQGSTFGVFKTCSEFPGPKLAEELLKNGFQTPHNQITVQTDGYNCGFYAPLFLWMLLIYDGNITEAVQKGVGINGKNIHGTKTFNGGINGIRKNLVG